MATTLNELAQLIIAMIDLNFQIIENLLHLTIYSSINSTLVSQNANLNFSNVWGITYGVLVSNYWNTRIMYELLNATEYNPAALRNFSLALNYLGSNATVVFGDMDANSGIAYIQKGVYNRLTSNSTELNSLALSLSKMLKTQIEFLIKLMKSVNKTFT